MPQTLERARWLGGKKSTRSVSAVNVKPDVALCADASNRLEIIERTGCRRARRRYDRHRALALVAETIESCQQQIYVEFVIARPDGDSASLSQSELTDCARHRIVCVLAVDDERWVGAHAFFESVGQCCVSRGQHRGEVRFCASRSERTSRTRAVSGEP